MKLKTRLILTAIAFILIPIICIALAFCVIGYTLTNHNNYGIVKTGFNIFESDDESYSKITQELIENINQSGKQNPYLLEDLTYLNELGEQLGEEASYLLVRKDQEIYYTNNQKAADTLFKNLPPYGYDNMENDTVYYYSKYHKLVKQKDFLFKDHSKGSFFVITKKSNLIDTNLLKDMVLATILILTVTAFGLTRWIHVGVIEPVRDLNQAMQKIAEGNLNYSIHTSSKGEIGELYANYEQMRLRLKESAEEKIQTETQNRELVSNISHDLKTPITAIKGYVEGIMDGVADTPEKMDRYIKTIYNKAMDMDRLINELTVYSKIDSNRIPYHFQKINVSGYFTDCVEEVGLELESKNIKLNYSNLVDTDTIIIADPEQLKRVINNIIGNSIKYMDKAQGEIEIRLLDEVDSIRVEIEDNGKGIASKDLSMIFDRFYRTDASRNSSKGGSGIGLSIVKKIIEDHGGYIWATSKEGEGTCMHFVIRKFQMNLSDT